MSSKNEIAKLQEALKSLKLQKATETHASRLAKKESENLPKYVAELERREKMLANATTEKDKKKYEKMVETAKKHIEDMKAKIEAMRAGPKPRATRKKSSNAASVASTRSTGKRAEAAAARAARAALLAKGESFYCYKAQANGKTGAYSGLLTIADGEVDWVEETKKVAVKTRSRASSVASTRASSPVANSEEPGGGAGHEGGARRRRRRSTRRNRSANRKATRSARRNRSANRKSRRNRKH